MKPNIYCIGALVLALSCALSAAAADKPAAAPTSRLDPVFPATTPGLVYVEGEDAVSTNMATEPTLNYGCSGNRALQLSRPGQLPGGAAYYADYSLYVEAAGSYELWYGGSPPGSKDEFTLSFASPVSVSIDGGEPRPLFREDVNVVERYAPAYYWVRTPAVALSQGAHVIRFEVGAKRRLDDRYFFYLDALFLATPEALAAAKADRTGFPDRFPVDPTDRRIDNPFRSIEDYQAQIQAKPAEIGPYIELADEYSLAGDYLNALKTLSKAVVVAPRNADARLLTAKNRIWRGDVKEGIEAYGIYLSLKPDDLDAYEEAGKVAAWSGRFSDSEYFYRTGLAAFPGNASLTVNMGLSLLWASRVADAEKGFADAERAALADAAGASRLAAIYRDNGFPDRAIDVYEKAITAFPDQLGLYLDEGALLASMSADKAEQELEARIAATFTPSAELDAILAIARAKRQLKADRIAALEARIAAEPENFGLRDELTRVYAWAGRRAEAARQLESILAARFARAISDSDTAIADVYSAHFAAAALRGDADARLAAIAALRAKAQAAQSAADKAMADLAAREKAEAAAAASAAAAAEKAAAAGKPAPAAASAPSSEGARAAARTALASLGSATADLAAEDARAATLAERATAAKAALDTAIARDEADEKAFAALTSGIGWSFDPYYASAELAVPAGRGEEIAALARARVLLTTKDAKSTLAALASVGSEALADGRRQAELMLGSRRDYRVLYKAASAADAGAVGSTGGASPALVAAAVELSAVAAAAARPTALVALAEDADSAALADFAGASRDELASALAADADAKAALGAARGVLASVIQGATTLQDRRLQRAWYAFESAALDLRSELGSYYDSLGRPEAATRQYRRVLGLDPSNIRAMHSLALAEEKAGDWATAASLLKSVNKADPYYGNAASLYNGIARTHAPSLGASTTFLADPNLFDYRSDANALFPLGSFLALKPLVDVRSIRDRNLGYPAYIGASLGLEAPITLSSGRGEDGVVVRPSGSLIMTSADFSAIGVSTVTPRQFLGALSMYSAGGLALDWAAGAWKGSAAYSYSPLPDSLNPALAEFNPDIFVLFAHKAEVSAGAYLPLGGVFRYLAPRVYASGSFVPNDRQNLFGTVLTEVIPAFRLSDRPWANLGIPLALVYEDSKDSHTSPYYSADQALTAKGGLLWQSSFPLKDEDALSISLEALGGLYTSKAFSSAPASDLYLYAFARLDWLRSGATYSLTLEASATDPFAAAPKYWSFSITGGLSAKQASLIAP